MAISSIGVGSGLPLEELLADLRRSENVALNANLERQVQAENRLSAYGLLKNSLETLQNAAQQLTSTDTYGAMKTQVTGDSYTASASGTAIPGEYSIQIESLASSQVLVTNGMASRTEAIGTGGIITFTLNDGSTKTLDLSASGTSLDDLVQAINNDSDLGFNATLVNDGSADTPHRLLLTASNTGIQASAASISVTGNPELNTLFSDLDIQDGTDATLNINGITITGPGNTIENAIEGVTLTLTSTSSESERLTVSKNDGIAAEAVRKFVTAYNQLQSTIKNLTSYDVDNQESRALTGDSLARRLQSDIRNTINVVSTEGDLRSLSQLGISTNVQTGALEIDDDRLNEALKNNMNDVQRLMTGADGLGTRLNTVADTFNRSGGMFSNTTDGISRTITDLKRQYEVTAERIEARMDNYRRQFTALDALVAQMNSVSTYLTQQLSMLGTMGNEK